MSQHQLHHRGTRDNGEITKRTIRLDSAGGIPAAAHRERSATSSPGESDKDVTSQKTLPKQNIKKTPILKVNLYSVGPVGIHHIVDERRVLLKTGPRLLIVPAGLQRDHMPLHKRDFRPCGVIFSDQATRREQMGVIRAPGRLFRTSLAHTAQIYDFQLATA